MTKPYKVRFCTAEFSVNDRKKINFPVNLAKKDKISYNKLQATYYICLNALADMQIRDLLSAYRAIMSENLRFYDIIKCIITLMIKYCRKFRAYCKKGEHIRSVRISVIYYGRNIE